jgi:hypothetical protein
VPYTLWNLYIALTPNQTKSPYRISIETLFTQCTRLLFYFNYVSTFYINLIASKHVRSIVKSYLLLLIGRKTPNNRVHPFTNQVSQSANRTLHITTAKINIKH